MKLIVVILSCLILIGCRTQAVLPLNTTDFRKGAYLKDLDNVLPFWVGTWEGISNNKKITLVLTFFEAKHFVNSLGNYHEDVLAGKFKITEIGSNQVTYNTLGASSYDAYPIGIVPFLNSSLSCTFQDDATRCYNTAQFILARIPGEQNQIKFTQFSLKGYDSFEGGCPQYDNASQIPMPLPTTDLILYRQP